ncbi:hypothetical protein MB46_19405 (plasmid) [Arthrobacter alpinus]|nr:hypothetical protein MB46_19405 [Arthrobacter alpinus]
MKIPVGCPSEGIDSLRGRLAMKSQTGFSVEPSSVLSLHPLVLRSSARYVSGPFDAGVATVRFPLHVFVSDGWWFWRKHLMLLPLSSRMPLEGEAGDEVAEVDMIEPEIYRVRAGFQPVVAVTRSCQLGSRRRVVASFKKCLS